MKRQQMNTSSDMLEQRQELGMEQQQHGGQLSELRSGLRVDASARTNGRQE